MNERVKELRKALNLTMDKFGERLGVGKTAISKIEKGENNLSDQMFRSICREYNVNEEWLRTGTGDMFIIIPEDEEVIAYTQKLLEGTDDVVAELIKNFIVTYMKLDETDKAVLQKVIADVLERQAEKEQP